jgi:hypothetical protein
VKLFNPIMMPDGWERRFVAYFHFIGFDCLSIGLHICWTLPNIEVHLPFGFIRIGWVMWQTDYGSSPDWNRTTYGITE